MILWLCEKEDQEYHRSGAVGHIYLMDCCGHCSIQIKKNCAYCSQSELQRDFWWSCSSHPLCLFSSQGPSVSHRHTEERHWQSDSLLLWRRKMVLVCPITLPSDWEEFCRSLHNCDNDLWCSLGQFVHVISVLRVAHTLKEKTCIFSETVLQFVFVLHIVN